jgi:hypothetical protein
MVGLALYRTPATKFDDLARRPTISCDRARSFVALVSTEGKSRLCEQSQTGVAVA